MKAVGVSSLLLTIDKFNNPVQRLEVIAKQMKRRVPDDLKLPNE